MKQRGKFFISDLPSFAFFSRKKMQWMIYSKGIDVVFLPMGGRPASAGWKQDIRWVEALLLMSGGVTIFLQSGVFKFVYAHTIFKYFNRKTRGK